MLTWENEQGSQHSLQVGRQFMLTSAVKLEQSKYDRLHGMINNQWALRVKFLWPFLTFSSVTDEKTDRGREVSWQLWTHLISSRSAIVERFK